MVWVGEMRLREELRVTPRVFSLKKNGWMMVPNMEVEKARG